MTSLAKARRENAATLYRRLSALGPSLDFVADADELQRISRALGRIGERQCNEDTACRKCSGYGRIGTLGDGKDCAACAGTGDTLGKREARLLAKARSIAEGYGLRVYHQSDPRGWQVYLIPTDHPECDDESRYNMYGIGVAS